MEGNGRNADKLIHHYFGIDYELLWDIIENRVEELNYQIKRIIEIEKQRLIDNVKLNAFCFYSKIMHNAFLPNQFAGRRCFIRENPCCAASVSSVCRKCHQKPSTTSYKI